jgi:hypothetical protein
VTQPMHVSSHIAGALLARINGSLSAHLQAVVGWVGNLPMATGKPILSISVGTASLSPRPGEVASFTVPPEIDEHPTSLVRIAHARVQFPVTMDLYLVAKDQAKQKRGILVERIIRELFQPDVGSSPRLDLVLANPEQTRVAIFPDGDVTQADSPESIERDEWRATFRCVARATLATDISKPFCREIDLGEDPGSLVPIDALSPP